MAHKSPASQTWWTAYQQASHEATDHQETREILATRRAVIQARREGTYSRQSGDPTNHGSRPIGAYRWSKGLPIVVGTAKVGEVRQPDARKVGLFLHSPQEQTRPVSGVAQHPA